MTAASSMTINEHADDILNALWDYATKNKLTQDGRDGYLRKRTVMNEGDSFGVILSPVDEFDVDEQDKDRLLEGTRRFKITISPVNL